MLVLVTQLDNGRDYIKPSDHTWITCTGAVAVLGASMYLQYLAVHITQRFSALNAIMGDNMSGKSKLARFCTLIRAIRLKYRALLGASIGWMLFDFLYYGPMCNGESISIQGNVDSLHAAIAQLILNVVVIALSYILSVYWFSSWIQKDRKNVQFIAFMLLCIFYIIEWYFDQGSKQSLCSL